MHISSFYR